MTAAEQAIASLKEDVLEKVSQIKMLENYDSLSEGGLSEGEYHALCETDMRYEDALGQSLCSSVPIMKYSRRGCNYFFYTAEGIEVRIPNSRTCGIEIVVPRYYSIPPKSPDYNTLKYWEREVIKYETFLNAKGLSKKAESFFGKRNKTGAVIRYLLTCPVKDYRTEAVQKLEKSRKTYTSVKLTIDRRLAKNTRFYNAQQEMLALLSAELLKWTDTVRVYQQGSETCLQAFKRP